MKTLGITLATGLLMLSASLACASGPSKYERCLESAGNDDQQIAVCKDEERERLRRAEERRRERQASPPATNPRPGGSY